MKKTTWHEIDGHRASFTNGESTLEIETIPRTLHFSDEGVSVSGDPANSMAPLFLAAYCNDNQRLRKEIESLRNTIKDNRMNAES